MENQWIPNPRLEVQVLPVPPMQLTQEQEVQLFRHLAYKSSYETGLDFGFDKYYKDAKAIRNSVINIYNRIKKNPAKYGIGDDVVTLVQDAMGNRALVRDTNNIPKAEKEIETGDIKASVLGVRDKAWRLIDRKLQRASKSNKKLDQIGLRELGTLAGIAFDKAQVISGQATENIALMGKIEGNIDPQAALDLVLKMREAAVASKQK